MKSPAVNILESTRNDRINLFLSNLNNNWTKFNDFYLHNKKCRIPVRGAVTNKHYYKFKIKFPISYESNTKYRIRVNKDIFDLYKSNNNYHFIDLYNPTAVDDNFYKDFCCTVYNSFIFYLFYSILSEVTKKQSITLLDMCYDNLTKEFNSEDSQFKITLTPFAVKNKIKSSDHLYLSIFN